MKKPIWILTGFTIVVAVFGQILKHWNESLVYNNFIYFLIYYYVVSFFSISLINFAIVKNKGDWMLFYFGSMVARFLVSVIVALLFMILDKQNVMVIGINFIILHLLFLGLDLFILINKVKKLSRKDQD